MKQYSIQVKSRGGATDGFVGTKDAINNWLSSWADPENLYATVEDETGKLLYEKPFGKKIIRWTNTTHIKYAFESMSTKDMK